MILDFVSRKNSKLERYIDMLSIFEIFYDLLDISCGFSKCVEGSNDRTHTRPGDLGYIDLVFLEVLEHADMSQSLGSSSSQTKSDFRHKKTRNEIKVVC